MKYLRQFQWAVLLLMLEINASWAAGPITVSDAWIRPAKQGMNTALYMKIVNHSTQDVALTDVSSPVANRIELHTTVDENGVMKMHHIDSIPCSAGQTTELKPGALHVMFLKLNHDLSIDDDKTVPVALHFSNRQDIMINVPVKKGACCGGCQH